MTPPSAPERAGPARVASPGAAHGDLVARRRAAAARLAGIGAASRVLTAPPGYVLAHSSADVARHCHLLWPLPAHGEARVLATPGRLPGTWHLDVASRDRPGLLAAFTGVLADSDLDVVQAVLATWDDGAALEAFVVTAAAPPEPLALQRAFETSLHRPLRSSPIADAAVSFTGDDASAYTSCEVRAADRPGLLHALAVGIAAAGADVHAACVTTAGRLACDRFDLSDRMGRRLDPTLENVVRRNMREGVAVHRPGRSPGPRRRRR